MNEMREAIELIDNDPEWLKRRLDFKQQEIDEWQRAYEELAIENNRFYAALRELTGGEYGFKARGVAKEALRGAGGWRD